ncbi:MAG: hypothetical protein ACPGSC_01870 [Granulosicoccaceae bacterium]
MARLLRHPVTLSFVASLVLAACSDQGSDTTDNSSYRNKTMPESASVNWPSSFSPRHGAEAAVSAAAAGGQATSSDGSSATSPPYIFDRDDLSPAYFEVQMQVAEAEMVIVDFEMSMKELDTVFGDIRSYCAAIPAGQECVIPAGTLTIEYPDELYDTLEGMSERGGVEVLPLSIPVAPGGNLPLGEVRYTVSPGQPYDWSLTVNRPMDQEQERATYQWNAAKDRFSVDRQLSWRHEDFAGSSTTQATYNDAAQTKTIELLYRWSIDQDSGDISDAGSLQQKIEELNDGRNGVRVSGSNRERWGDINYQHDWRALANDDGGSLSSTTHQGDDEPARLHRESFDGEGKLVSAQYCEAVTENHCDNDDNWNDAKEGWWGILPPIVEPPVLPPIEWPDITVVPVMGLSSGTEFFVVVPADEAPTDDWSNTLCHGFVWADAGDSPVEALCEVSVDELADVSIHAEIGWDEETGRSKYRLEAAARLDLSDID